MRCVMCKHGETQPGKVMVTLQRGDAVVIIKDVPAEVCRQCGDYYVEQETTTKIMAAAEKAVRQNVEVEIVRYAV